MVSKSNKIGYTENGGFFIARDITSDFHENFLISIIISFGEPFQIITQDNAYTFRAVLIQQGVYYKLKSGTKDDLVFIHLDPYSEAGLNLSSTEIVVMSLDHVLFSGICIEFKYWKESEENSITDSTRLLRKTCKTIIDQNNFLHKAIDIRITKIIKYIKNSEWDNFTLKEMADRVQLSPSRFSHLFKEQTGSSFKKFVLHTKLIKSIHAIHQTHNLTESSYIGGFADQPHFIKTFKGAFGIKPSVSKK